jgi:3-phosphoshikimate 1-carboxyvinyltransferase
MTTKTISAPAGAFSANHQVPGDKSLTHRAFILSAMAEGASEVVNPAPGHDIAATVAAIESVGVEVHGDRVSSPGVNGWTAPLAPIDCGNSGTTMRLMAGALAGRPFRSTLTGDASLRARPMGRLREPLEALGARLETSEADTAPITVGGAESLRGADISISVASAQVRTAFTLAALQATGDSSVTSPAGYRDHTERWLAALGRGSRRSGERFEIAPGPVPAGRWTIPGDPSSAAFLWAAAAARSGSTVTTPGVSLNPGRIGFLQVLDEMGAVVEAEVTENVGGEPIGVVTVKGRGLFGVEIRGPVTVATLDELPLVGVLATLAEGVTTVHDAAELRAKESDRISSTVSMLQNLSGAATELSDGFEVVGTGWLEPGTVVAAGDHRIAMAAAVAAIGCTGAVTVTDAEVADVSWPGFYEVLEAIWSSQ